MRALGVANRCQQAWLPEGNPKRQPMQHNLFKGCFLICSVGSQHCSAISSVGLHVPKIFATGQISSSWLSLMVCRSPIMMRQPDAGSAASTNAAAEGPKPQAGPGSQPAAEAAMPSPAQWAAEETQHTGAGSTGAEEPVQRMQPASNLAGSSAETDSSAAAGEQPRGSRQDTTMRLDGSTAAQPGALSQPDVHGLGDADISLQDQQSFAEAEVSMRLQMDPECTPALLQAQVQLALCACVVCAAASCLKAPACLVCLLAAGCIIAEHSLLRRS